MPKLIFRGTSIRFVDLRYDKKSKQTYAKINFSASFSEPVRKEMQWAELPAGYDGGGLDGELSATSLELIPNGSLKPNAIDLSANHVGKFEVHRVTDGESTTTELRFQAVTSDPKAGRKLHDYLQIVGKGEAQLKVGYEAQSELEMEAETAEEGEPLISEEQADDTAEELDGEQGDAPLASAAVMGGTHQKGTRGKKRAEPVN